MRRESPERPLAVLAILTAIGIAGFWVAFFSIGLAPAAAPPCFLPHERAFPVPDAALSAVLLAAGVLLWRGRPLGRTLGLVAAGALVFLGLLDAAFNLQQGIYALSTGDLVGNAAINVWCVALGLVLAVRLRR